MPGSAERRCTLEVQLVWETPEFDEVGVGAEVTMYIAQLED
jgi:coenzyme PQQ precursor peptide PqqA